MITSLLQVDCQDFLSTSLMQQFCKYQIAEKKKLMQKFCKYQKSGFYRLGEFNKLAATELVDNLQQAGKVHNSKLVCGVSSCVNSSQMDLCIPPCTECQGI